VDLVRVEVIGDDTEDIAATALRLRGLVGDSGAVFTSGGIGATHDDVTYEALAAAHGAPPQGYSRLGQATARCLEAEQAAVVGSVPCRHATSRRRQSPPRGLLAPCHGCGACQRTQAPPPHLRPGF